LEACGLLLKKLALWYSVKGRLTLLELLEGTINPVGFMMIKKLDVQYYCAGKHEEKLSIYDHL